MDTHFIQKIVWNALKALSYNITGFCILTILLMTMPFYLNFTPHIFFVLGCFGHYKASECELMRVKKARGDKSQLKEFKALKVALHKKVSGTVIVAGSIAPLELIRSLRKIHRGETTGIENLSVIIFLTILLMFGILWNYNIWRDTQEE